MQPSVAEQLPLAPKWLHEVKHDGYRIIARINRGEVRLHSRHRNDHTKRMAPLATSLAKLGVRNAIIDGEVGAPDESGVTHGAHHTRSIMHRQPERLAYFAFDLLWLNDRDLRELPFIERKLHLQKLLRRPPAGVLYVEHVGSDQAAALFDALVAIGGEGVVSKYMDAPYRSGRTKLWVKVKPLEVRQRQAEEVRALHRRK
jgi:bifunctional non-homologous end joining protein LigD